MSSSEEINDDGDDDDPMLDSELEDEDFWDEEGFL